MPLSRRARIEIYLPESQARYRRLQTAFEQEFLLTFGGCTVIEDIKGLYLSRRRQTDTDGISSDLRGYTFDFDKNFKALSKYTDELREAALEASERRIDLIVVHEIYHSL